MKSWLTRVNLPWVEIKNKVLFLEDLNEEYYRIDFMLSQLKLSGILDGISGLILGKFHKCPPKIRKSESGTLNDIFRHYIKDLDIPVVSNVAYGHVPVKLTFPIGINIQIDTSVKFPLIINESAVI